MNNKKYIICTECNGSGEGMHDRSRCLKCNGTGTQLYGYVCPLCDQITDIESGTCQDCSNRIQDEAV